MAAALCTHTVVLFGNSVLFLGRRLGLDFNESQEPHHSLNYYLLLASFLWVLNFLNPFTLLFLYNDGFVSILCCIV